MLDIQGIFFVKKLELYSVGHWKPLESFTQVADVVSFEFQKGHPDSIDSMVDVLGKECREVLLEEKCWEKGLLHLGGVMRPHYQLTETLGPAICEVQTTEFSGQ